MPKHFTAELCMLLTLLLVVATLCASSALPTLDPATDLRQPHQEWVEVETSVRRGSE